MPATPADAFRSTEPRPDHPPAGRRVRPRTVGGLLLVAVLLAAAVVRLSGGLPALTSPRPTPSAAVAPVFYDSFDGERLSAGRWQAVDTAGVLTPMAGELVFGGARTAAAWGDPAVYSAEGLARRAGRTLAAVARPDAGVVRGPLFVLSPARFPADPTTAGYGGGFESVAAASDGADVRLVAVTPEGRFLYDPEVARPTDHLVATTLRPSGSYHFVSGGAFGTFPVATLIWVNGVGTDDAVYVGVDAQQTSATVSAVQVVDLQGGFATPYGLAKAVDTFDRADATALGRTEGGGNVWSEPQGDVRIAGGGLVRAGSGEARAVFDSGVADGIVELEVRTPSEPFASPSLYFRYQDERNWWALWCGRDRVGIMRAVGGVESVPFQTGAAACGEEGTYRLVVRAHGPYINAWVNATNMTFSHGLVDDTLAAATGVGVGFDAEETSPVVDQIIVWPKTVTLPPEVGPFPTVADGAGRTVVHDTFAEPSGKRLQNHRLDVGGPWREYAGRWTVAHGSLVPVEADPSGGSALAAVATGLTDVGVAATFALPSGDAAGASDSWVGGPVLRYTDGRSFIWARFLRRPGGAALELWEHVGGASQLLGVSDVTGLMTPEGRHTIKAAAVGKRVAAYLDGVLVAEGTTTVLSGTWAGLLVEGASVAAPGHSIVGFRVAGANADSVAPPPVVDLSLPSTTGAVPSLSWPPSVDDASGTRYYRVFRSTAAGRLGSQINKDGETTEPAHTDASVGAGGTYCYTVAAVDSAGNTGLAGSTQRCVVYETGGAPGPGP